MAYTYLKVMMKVAIQGAQGSFHEMAAKKYFGDDTELICCETFGDVFDVLSAGVADMAVTAIGNSRFGGIDEVFDRIIKSHLPPASQQYWIHGEVYITVEQCLLGVPGATLHDIHEVHSQAPALGQCGEFLRGMLPQSLLVEQEDTAGSARLIARLADKTKAAIASRAAAELYGLEVLAAGIQDDMKNITRFLVVSTHPVEDPLAQQKISLILRTNHKPGALARALTILSTYNINLAYIQSIPVPDIPFQYRFYIDIDDSRSGVNMSHALKKLEAEGYEVKTLGGYKTDGIPLS